MRLFKLAIVHGMYLPQQGSCIISGQTIRWGYYDVAVDMLISIIETDGVNTCVW